VPTFDELDELAGADETIAPLCSIDWKSSEEFLSWFKRSVARIDEDEEKRVERIRNNSLRYKGYYNFGDKFLTRTSPRDPLRPDVREISTNHTQDLIKTSITQILYNKPNTVVVPASNEASDKQSARISKELLESLKYQNRIEQVYFQVMLQAQIAGEGYGFTLWDENRGAIHPKYKVAERNKTLEIPLLDSRGEPVLDAQGEAVTVRPPQRVGDVRYFVPLTENVLVWPAYRFDEVECIALKTVLHVKTARKRWPEDEEEIKPTDDLEVFDYNVSENKFLRDHVEVYYFFHRSTPELPGGGYVVCTKDTVLEEFRTLDISPEATDGAELGNIPAVRLVDLHMPGELHGWSAMHNINQLQSRYDKCTTLVDRNIFLTVHPKIVAPRGSTLVEKLVGDELVVEYDGPVPPRVVVFPAGTAEVFNYRASIQEQMEKIKGIFSISRGAPPPGTRSAAQQMFWQEQQEQRSSLDRMNFHQFAVELDMKSLGLCASKYRQHDERLLKVLGKDKSWEVKAFDVESLASSFDIRVQASSALPESKFARTETLMNLNQAFPDIFRREEVISMLGFGLDEKFIDLARAPIIAAEYEEERWQSGQKVKDPEKFEDLQAHWQTHYRFVQAPSFKEQPKNVMDMVLEHIGKTEMLMWAKATINPSFKQMLLTLPQFPIVFVLPPEPQAPPQAAPAPPPPGPQEGLPLDTGVPPELPQTPPPLPPVPLEPQDPLIAGNALA
jgi:hypothetical protein